MKPNLDCLFQTASAQMGYFTGAQAAECGYNSALLSHHSTTGRFRRVRRGLYRLRDYPSAPREEVMAAWLSAGPGAAISHESALDLLGLTDVIPSKVHVSIPRSRRGWAVPPQVVAHTLHSRLTPADTVERQGMRITSPARTIIDVAEAGLSPEQVERAITEAVERGIATPDQLLELARQRNPRVAGSIARALGRMPA